MTDLKFIHRFSRTVWCTPRIRDDPPAPGKTVVWDFEWTGRQQRRHLAEYRRWVFITAQLLADRWNTHVLYGLGVSPICMEFWGFEPKGTPKLIQKVALGIP
jgi:hypothetical protein